MDSFVNSVPTMRKSSSESESAEAAGSYVSLREVQGKLDVGSEVRSSVGSDNSDTGSLVFTEPTISGEIAFSESLPSPLMPDSMQKHRPQRRPQPSAGQSSSQNALTYPLGQYDSPATSPSLDGSSSRNPRLSRLNAQSRSRQFLLQNVLNNAKAKSSSSSSQLAAEAVAVTGESSSGRRVHFTEQEITGALDNSGLVLLSEDLAALFYSEEEVGGFKTDYEAEFKSAAILCKSWYDWINDPEERSGE